MQYIYIYIYIYIYMNEKTFICRAWESNPRPPGFKSGVLTTSPSRQPCWPQDLTDRSVASRVMDEENASNILVEIRPLRTLEFGFINRVDNVHRKGSEVQRGVQAESLRPINVVFVQCIREVKGRADQRFLQHEITC